MQAQPAGGIPEDSQIGLKELKEMPITQVRPHVLSTSISCTELEIWASRMVWMRGWVQSNNSLDMGKVHGMDFDDGIPSGIPSSRMILDLEQK